MRLFSRMTNNYANRMNVLMAGVGRETKGGMWSVVEGYLTSTEYAKSVNLTYIPMTAAPNSTSIAKIFRAGIGYARFVLDLTLSHPELVHLHVSENGSVYRKNLLAKTAKVFNCKVLLHFHGGSFREFYCCGSERDRKVADELLNMADCVVTIGQFYRDFLISIGVAPGKLCVIYNGVSIPAMESLSTCRHDEIVYLGAITPEKGLMDLLNAIEFLPEKILGRYSFSLYGPISTLKIEEEITKRQLSDIVRYGGFLDANAKNDVMRNAAFAILPSHFEVLPMFILEAMSYGTPVLATDVGAVSEVISDRVDGFLCEADAPSELSQAIAFICSLDETYRKIVGQRARKKIKTGFSVEKHVNEIIKQYRMLIASNYEKSLAGNSHA